MLCADIFTLVVTHQGGVAAFRGSTVWNASPDIQKASPPLGRARRHTGTEVKGLFMTADVAFDENEHQLEGLWVDATRVMKLPYIVFFGTFGHEPMGLACYFANRFPHNTLRWESLRGKLSNEPRHNARRVRALWRKLLEANVQRRDDGESSSLAEEAVS